MFPLNMFQKWAGKKIVIISPHPDDAAFSTGGLITRLKNTTVLLVTVFSRSCNENRADEQFTTHNRAAEDDAYARQIGAEIVRLGLPDSGIRTNRGMDNLSVQEEKEIRLQIKTLLPPVLRKQKNTAVLAPLGIGEHPDHIHCIQEACDAITDGTLIFYEDQPYAQFLGGPDIVKQRVREQYPFLREVYIGLTNAQMNSKLKGMDLYKSQLHPQWRADIERYARSLGMHNGGYGERYWTAAGAQEIVYSLAGIKNHDY